MEYDYEMHELLQTAIDEGMIDEATAGPGVAKYCFDHGYTALTRDQKAVFDQYVAPSLREIVERREVEARMSGMPD